MLSLPELICSHTGPASAAQTHSHSPAIVMMCPMPPVHGAALFIYCSVSHMQYPSYIHTLSHHNVGLHTRKDTHTHTHTVKGRHTITELQSVSHKHAHHPCLAMHLTCQSHSVTSLFLTNSSIHSIPLQNHVYFYHSCHSNCITEA